MSVLVVSGTSTDVGKTIVTAALVAALRAAGRSVAVCKPAQTGVTADEPGDLAEVTRLSGVTATVELARYPEPLAPDTAARRSGMPMLTRSDVVAVVRELDATYDVTIVEGAGDCWCVWARTASRCATSPPTWMRLSSWWLRPDWARSTTVR